MNEGVSPFLPISARDMRDRGWDQIDIVLVTGDAYVDHPSFGTSVIGRVLEAGGYRVGIIAMPDWRDPASMTVFGKPRLFFGVSSGNVDSMIARYTAFKKVRNDDPYVPGGEGGGRPDRAVIAYCNLIKRMYKDVPIVLGGIEASMRRMVHYDFWSDKVRRSILLDTRASILVYGMAETVVDTIAKRIAAGETLSGIPNTVTIQPEMVCKARLLPPEETVIESKEVFLKFYKQFYRFQHQQLVQKSGNRYLVHEPPDAHFSSRDLDQVYALPFTRQPHPDYDKTIPAFEMIRNSVTSHRGCVSGCSFCSLTMHQGKRIVSRSPDSVLNEVRHIAESPEFTGQISDIGGPSANMFDFNCKQDWICGRESCLFPEVCPNLSFGNQAWLDLLKKASEIRGVKKVSVGSGIRYDLFMLDPNAHRQLQRLVRNHVSGQLKIAPEHNHPKTLKAMRKPPLVPLQKFVQAFQRANTAEKKKQYLLPYLMSNHPGGRKQEMGQVRRKIQSDFGFAPDQVQSFIPLPMTLSSVIYYTGVDPLTGERFFVTRDGRQRQKEHALYFKQSWSRPHTKRSRSPVPQKNIIRKGKRR